MTDPDDLTLKPWRDLQAENDRLLAVVKALEAEVAHLRHALQQAGEAFLRPKG